MNALLLLTVLAQSYTRVAPVGDAPSPRIDGTIAYDTDAGKLYVFGGQDQRSLNDLWSFSLAQKTWSRVETGGRQPLPRFGHTLLFDTKRHRLVLFGGQGSGFFSDVWVLDTTTKEWTQLAFDDAGPRRRYGHSAVFDPLHDRMVISHGFTDSGRFDDTWGFEFGSNTWRNLTPEGAKPLKRCLHHAVLDAATQQMYLYGGCASGFGPCPLGDLWVLSLKVGTWRQLTGGVTPPPREHYGMAYDARRGKIVLFGGIGGGLLMDTWEYDPQAAAWSQPVTSGGAPSARYRHEAVYAADRGSVFFFGGSTNNGNSNDLWELQTGLSPLPRLAAGVEAIAPGEIVSLYGNGLGPAEGLSGAVDPLTGGLARKLGEVRVEVNGVNAPLYYAQNGQVNLQAPVELAGASEATISLYIAGEKSNELKAPVVRTHPTLFPVVLNPDGSLNSTTNPAAAGSVVVLFGTGQGLTSPALKTGEFAGVPFALPLERVSVAVGGEDLELLYAGLAPGTVGVLQVNARVKRSGDAVLRVGSTNATTGLAVYVK